MDQDAICAMNHRPFPGGPAAPIEYKALPMVRKPRKIGAILSEEDDH
jgi:hypothetical protein